MKVIEVTSALGKIVLLIGLLVGANATLRADEISEQFKFFFEEGISEYLKELPRKLKTVALWHVAISKLDIPDQEDCTKDSIDLFHQLLSTLVNEISSVPYPNPFEKTDPNHDWIGRADYGFLGLVNRFNHDTLNMMRQASSSLHFIYMMRRDRPELWNRILNGRNIPPMQQNECNARSCTVSGNQEKLYLQNIFVTAFMVGIIRFNEGRERYKVVNSKNDVLMKEWTTNGFEPQSEFQLENTPSDICSGWLLQRIGTSRFYKPLLGQYIGHMVHSLTLVNPVKNKIEFFHRIFFSESNRTTDYFDISDEAFAAHAEKGFVYFGHYLDHVRLNYSHFTIPVGTRSTFLFDLMERIFGKNDEEKFSRLKESYSFWSYLTKQAGIFDRMRHPEEINFEKGKTFLASNPWLEEAMAFGNTSKWTELGKHFAEKDITPGDKRSTEQKAFQEKVRNYDKMFDAFFDKENLKEAFHERQKGLVDFFLGVFSETNIGVCKFAEKGTAAHLCVAHDN